MASDREAVVVSGEAFYPQLVVFAFWEVNKYSILNLFLFLVQIKLEVLKFA